MKKLVAILLCATIGISVMGCGNKKEPENGAGAASKYKSALDVLTTVADAYGTWNQKFPMAGGDSFDMLTEAALLHLIFPKNGGAYNFSDTSRK